MTTTELIAQMEAERDRINAALSALNGHAKRQYTHRRGARHQSAAARKLISQQMKLAWARRKKAA